MRCESPLTVTGRPKYVKGVWVTNFPADCGKCPVCRKNKVREWCFRLVQEDKYSLSSCFVTLTYSPKYVPMSENGYMTLDKGYKTEKGSLSTDLKRFLKRLRKLDEKSWKEHKPGVIKKKISYYACGEYGSKSDRPHYHLIIFNLFDYDNIQKAWTEETEKGEREPIGSIHIGRTTGASVAYTLKYLDKTKRIPQHINDDRRKEYQVQSKGLGDGYLTDDMIKYHKEELSRYYIIQDGYKIKMPRYYRERIYDDKELMEISKIIEEYYEKKMDEKKRRIQRIYKNKVSLDYYLQTEKEGRIYKFQSQIKNRNNAESI